MSFSDTLGHFQTLQTLLPKLTLVEKGLYREFQKKCLKVSESLKVSETGGLWTQQP